MQNNRSTSVIGRGNVPFFRVTYGKFTQTPTKNGNLYLFRLFFVSEWMKKKKPNRSNWI